MSKSLCILHGVVLYLWLSFSSAHATPLAKTVSLSGKYTGSVIHVDEQAIDPSNGNAARAADAGIPLGSAEGRRFWNVGSWTWWYDNHLGVDVTLGENVRLEADLRITPQENPLEVQKHYIEVSSKSYGLLRIGNQNPVYASAAWYADALYVHHGLEAIHAGVGYDAFQESIVYESPDWKGLKFMLGLSEAPMPDAKQNEANPHPAFESKIQWSYNNGGTSAGAGLGSRQLQYEFEVPFESDELEKNVARTQAAHFWAKSESLYWSMVYTQGVDQLPFVLHTARPRQGMKGYHQALATWGAWSFAESFRLGMYHANAIADSGLPGSEEELASTSSFQGMYKSLDLEWFCDYAQTHRKYHGTLIQNITTVALGIRGSWMKQVFESD